MRPPGCPQRALSPLPAASALPAARSARSPPAHTSTSLEARAAGFADAAHMTRTFRRMFGVSPSDLRRRSQVFKTGEGRTAIVRAWRLSRDDGRMTR
ncbi:helix-turn-helix domain-containing protein [Sorangium sp. So ce1182]